METTQEIASTTKLKTITTNDTQKCQFPNPLIQIELQSNQYNIQYPTHSCSPPTRVQSSPRASRYSPLDNYNMTSRPPPYSHQTSKQMARSDFRNDSFSSDATSEPNIIRRNNQRVLDADHLLTYSPFTDKVERFGKYSLKYPNQSSYSSSEEYLPTSVDWTSGYDRDHDTESVSEREHRPNPRVNQPRNQINEVNYTNKQPVNWKLSQPVKEHLKKYILDNVLTDPISIVHFSS